MTIFQATQLLKATKAQTNVQERSVRPPKKKWKEMVGAIQRENPGMSEERASAIAGNTWYNRMSVKARKKARNVEGKQYGKPVAKSRLVIGADTSNYRQLVVLTAGQVSELEKAVRGFIKPGHKYLRREMKGDKWVYYYLEDVGEPKEAAPGEETPRRLLGKEDILITELDRKGRTSIEDRVKVYIDKTSIEYDQIRKKIRKLGGWISKEGMGTMSIDALRKLHDTDPTFWKKVIYNEWGATLVRKVMDNNLAELLEPGLERPDLEEAKKFNPTYNYELEPPKSLRKEMIIDGKAVGWDGIHPYQKAGINYLFEQKSAILGYDVGLGKTLTALSACEKYFEDKQAKGEKWKPTLITCPNEVLLNWYREMNQYFEGMSDQNVLILPPGGARGREFLKELIDSGKIKQYKYVIGGYGWLMDDESCEYLAHAQDWGVHIVDEGHRLKSSRAHVSENYDNYFRDGRKHVPMTKEEGREEAGYELGATGQTRSDYQWFLTATPVPNAIEEGYTMLDHLQFGKDDASNKERRYRRLVEKKKKRKKGSMSQLMIEAQQQMMLNEIRDVFREKAMVKTYTDEDVRATLPAVEEKLWTIPMNGEQQELYNMALMKALDMLSEKMGPSGTIEKMRNPMALLTRLNQITIHPKLVFPNYQGRSAKMDWIADTVDAHFKNEKDGIVVMCEQIEALKICKAQLVKEKGIPEDQIVIIDQKLKGKEKDEVTQRFNRGEIKVLLGGKTAEEGINLQRGAHKIVHMDVPWVPKTLVQRNGRVLRQGQKNPVQVFFPLTHGASDIHRLSLLYEKLTLNEAVLNMDNLDTLADGKLPGTDEELGVTDVMELLRHEAQQLKGGEDVPKTYEIMGDEWKKKVKAPDGKEVDAYHFIDGSKVPVGELEDLTQDFRDIKLPKQWKEVFNYSLHAMYKITNPEVWKKTIASKRPRLTVRKAFPTIREMIGDHDGYTGYYNTGANQIIVDTRNSTTLAHEMAHYMRFTHRSEQVLQDFNKALRKAAPSYFERMKATNPAWYESYLKDPDELYARMFEQMVAYKTKQANPNFHPMIAKSFESYASKWWYMNEAEWAHASGQIEGLFVDRDGNRLFKTTEMVVAGQPEEAKPEPQKVKKLTHEQKVNTAILHIAKAPDDLSDGDLKARMVAEGLTQAEAHAVVQHRAAFSAVYKTEKGRPVAPTQLKAVAEARKTLGETIKRAEEAREKMRSNLPHAKRINLAYDQLVNNDKSSAEELEAFLVGAGLTEEQAAYAVSKRDMFWAGVHDPEVLRRDLTAFFPKTPKTGKRAKRKLVVG